MLNPGDIIAVVEETFGLPHGSIVARNKTMRVTRARWFAAGLILAARPELTLSDLGRTFGQDHSTISYGQTRLMAMLKDPAEPYHKVTWQTLHFRLGLPEPFPDSPEFPRTLMKMLPLEAAAQVRITIEINQKGEVLVPALLEFLAKHSAQAKTIFKSWEMPI